MDDAIVRYLEDHDVHFELSLISDGGVVRKITGTDLSSIEEQMHKLEGADTNLANEELQYSQYEWEAEYQ
jgi:hypothetical protein